MSHAMHTMCHMCVCVYVRMRDNDRQAGSAHVAALDFHHSTLMYIGQHTLPIKAALKRQEVSMCKHFISCQLEN